MKDYIRDISEIAIFLALNNYALLKSRSETLRRINGLLDEHVFMGDEDKDYIGTGIIGAEKENSLIKRIFQFYVSEIWNVDFYNNPMLFKHILLVEPEKFEACRLLNREVL